jgi:hypothetical protein
MVVVMSALGDAVVEAAVVKKDTTDDAELREKADGAEDGGPAGATAAVDQVVDREVAILLKDGGDDGATRRSNAMTARFKFKANRFEIGHVIPRLSETRYQSFRS